MRMGLGEPTGPSGWGRQVEALCAQIQFELSPAGDWAMELVLFFFFFLTFGCPGSLMQVFLWLQQAWASHCRGFSCCGAGALGRPGFSSCSSQL